MTKVANKKIGKLILIYALIGAALYYLGYQIYKAYFSDSSGERKMCPSGMVLDRDGRCVMPRTTTVQV